MSRYRYSPSDRHFHEGEDDDCYCDAPDEGVEYCDDERERVGWVDAGRGLAVLLMVLDHVLVQVAPGHLLRYTVTRWSLPLFMIVAAWSWRSNRGLSSRRLRQLCAAVVVECVLLSLIGMAQPGPVALAAMVLVGVSLAPFDVWQVAGPLAICGLLQAAYLPITWPGYQPGTLLAYFCVGLLGCHQFAPALRRLPRCVEAVGRRPLLWYCGHLAVILVAVRGGLL